MVSCDCSPAAPDSVDASRSVKHFQDSFFWVAKKIKFSIQGYSAASSSFALRTIGAIVAKNRTT